jgi:hypothetical protein
MAVLTIELAVGVRGKTWGVQQRGRSRPIGMGVSRETEGRRAQYIARPNSAHELRTVGRTPRARINLP